MLRAGYSLQYVKDAGGWKSVEVLSRIYGHLERKEWAAGVKKVGNALIDQIGADDPDLIVSGTLVALPTFPHGFTQFTTRRINVRPLRAERLKGKTLIFRWLGGAPKRI